MTCRMARRNLESTVKFHLRALASKLQKTIPMIAIVDDDDAVRRAIKRLVQSRGYSASTFASADKFLKSEQVSNTTCVITDLHMPGLSGLDLQDRLAAGGHRIPIIFITAYPEQHVKTRAVKAGALAFLSKPLNHDQLLGYLEKALKTA